MKRIATFLAILAVTVCTAMAQVKSDPVLIPYAYAGKIVLTYNPNAGWGGMSGVDHCYSHIGLITSESLNMKDWKYLKDDAWGQPTEPEWTKQADGTYRLEINNMFDYFGCPKSTKIKAIVMVFHDGRGASSIEGKDRNENDIVVWLEDETATCHYIMDLSDSANDSWNGDAMLTVKEGTFTRDYWVEYGMSPMRVYVPCYGGNPEFVWTAGSWDSENSIAIYKSNGVCVYSCNGTMAAGTLYTATTPMCDASPNPWEVKNLKVEAKDPSKPLEFLVSWDAVSSVENYEVIVRRPDQYIAVGPELTSGATSLKVDLSDMLISGDYSFEVKPVNNYVEPYGEPSKQTKNIVIPPIGEVEISVLIPTDNDFDIAHDIYAYWRSSIDGTINGDVKLTRDGTSRVWKGKVNITAPMYDLEFHSAEVDKLHYRTFSIGALREGGCFEIGAFEYMNDSDPEHLINYHTQKHHPDCSKMIDHNYLISNVTITPGQATMNVKITAENKAPFYMVTLYTDDHFTNVYSSYIGDDLTFTVETNNSEVIPVRSWKVVAEDEDAYYVGTAFKSTATFDIQPSAYTATNIVVEQTSVGTYKVSFDAASGVDKYTAYFYDENYKMTDAGQVIVKVTPPTDGRYTLSTSDVPEMRGSSYVYISAYRESTLYPGEYDFLLSTVYHFTGKINLKTYIPQDSNFEKGTEKSGVFAWIWSPKTFKDGFCYEMFEDGDAVHFHNDGIYVNDEYYQFLFVNKEIKGKSDWVGCKQTLDSKEHNTYETCSEIPYKPNKDQAKWALKEYDWCGEMTIHDYRINFVSVVPLDGRVEFNINPMMSQADKYRISVNVKGIPQAFYTEDIYDLSRTIPANNTEDMTFQYTIVPISYEGDTLAEPYSDEVFVPKNTFMPKNLKAEVQSDGKTVNFSWTAEANPFKWQLVAMDKAETVSLLNKIIDGTETSLTAKIYMKGECIWTLFGLNSSEDEISELQGPNFTIAGEDYSPTKITITPDELNATVTWEAPEAVKFGCISMYNSEKAHIALKEDIAPVAGKFSASFTAPKDGIYYFEIISYFKDGATPVYMSSYVKTENVKLEKAVMVKLQISAAIGGSVNKEVNGTYKKGEKVTIIATPDKGYVFAQWSDGNKDATREIVMDEDKTLEASFVAKPAEYEVTIKAGEHGSVTPTGYDKKKVESGTKIDINATAETGYVFLNWSDGSTDAARSITISQDTVLIANFIEFKQYEVTIKAGEHGSVTPTGYDKTKVDAGTKIDINATAETGYVFLNWSDGSTDAARSIVISQDTVLTANFVEYKEYEVTIKAGEHGSVTPTGYDKKKVAVGTKIDIKATPDEGYKFSNWSDGNTAAARSIVISQDTVLEASFVEIKQYEVTIKAGEHGSVTPTGYDKKKVAEGTTIDIKATPDEGYKFGNWSDGSTDAKRSVIISQDTVLEAIFVELESFTLTVYIEPDDDAGIVYFDGTEVKKNKQTYVEGTTVELSVEANKGYKFVRWEEGPDTDSSKEISVVMNKAHKITAVFKSTTAIENVAADAAAPRKVLIDGQIYIIRNGKMYTPAGALVK